MVLQPNQMNPSQDKDDETLGSSPKSVPQLTPPTPKYRDWLDVGAQREAIERGFTSGLDGLSFGNDRYDLRLSGVQVHRKAYDNTHEKRAIGERANLHHPVKGTWELVDKATGDIVDKKQGTVAYMPHLTNRGTFIVNGSNYVVTHQTRLRPGAYTYMKNNGVPTSQISVVPRTGRNFGIDFDQEKAKFQIKIGQGSSRLYPFLKAMGVEDDAMKAAWGEEIWKANATEDRNDQDLKKTLDRLGIEVPEDATDEDKAGIILKEFSRAEVDPEVMEFTTGKAHSNLSPEVLLGVASKILQVNRGEAKGDDRDSMAFQKIFGPEDFWKTRIKNDVNRAVRTALWKATKSGTLKSMPSVALRDTVYGVFNGTGLAMALEDTNPMLSADLRLKLTRMGEGGLSPEASPRSARGVQPSHLGLIDPIRTPECHDEQTEVMTDHGWVKWSEVNEDTFFACLINGQLQFHRADRLIAEPYKGPMYGAQTATVNYLVTPNHRMWVKPKGNKKKGHDPLLRFETADQICDKTRLIPCAGHAPFCGNSMVGDFQLPETETQGNHQREFTELAQILWAELLGWYISEGSTSRTVTKISQLESANPRNVARIHELLDHLPFSYSYDGKDFSICGKQLTEYLHSLGLCDQKSIPDYVFHYTPEARQAFIDAALAGDGRTDRYGKKYAYCTTSEQLAQDFQRLLFLQGVSSRIVFEPDDREDRYLGCWIVQIHSRTVREVAHKSHRHPNGVFYTKEYDGTVYCATVPGSLLYTRRNGSVGIWSGNSGNIGLDLRAAHNTFKGEDNKIYTKVLGSDGKEQVVAAQDLLRKPIAFPGELDTEGNKVRVMHNGDVKYMNREDVGFWLPNAEEMFAQTTNLVPLVSGIKGQRALMGARMTTQALPLVDREAPFVQAQSDTHKDKWSFDKILGEQSGAVRASEPALVLEADSDKIVLQKTDGSKQTIPLYNNMPLNRKTGLHQTAMVQPGQMIEAGQMLAKSNFTNDDGVLAMGRNLRVGYLSHEGGTFEDAVVISQSAADRMKSEHMYQYAREQDKSVHSMDTKDFIGMFPGKYTKEQLSAFDKDGVIKPGTKLKHGDPILLQIDKKARRGVGAITRGQKSGFKDASQVWDHHAEGEVVDAYRTKSGVKLFIKTSRGTEVGDKLSARYGNKGVVSKILPDDQMPHSKDGRPLDVLLTPAGVISRTNPSVLVEAALGKVAEKTGKPYVLPGFTTESMVQKAMEELEKHGLSDTETVIDPATGKEIHDVFTGNGYFMRLAHLAEDKLSARDVGSYTSDGMPAKGGKEGAKQVGHAMVSALISHGAVDVIKDNKLVRGQRNDDYWNAIRMGYTPNMPTDSVAAQKFVAQLKSAGVNVNQRGTTWSISPLIDKHVEEMAGGREITGTGTFDWDTMKPRDGGLFDVSATGGADGTLWSFYRLPEKVPNPIAEEPIRSMLGLTQKQFRAVLSGEEEIGGMRGAKGIRNALQTLGQRMDKEIASTKTQIATASKSKRNAAVKRLGYLTSMQQMGIAPSDLLIEKMPILPPKFRPITRTESMDLIADPNYLYADMINAGKNHSEQAELFGESPTSYLTMYDSVKAVSGMGSPVTRRSQEKQVKGILRSAVGKGLTPKMAQFQRRIIGGAVDQVGRGVITPNAKLNIDQIGVPKEMAWNIFEPYVIGRLSQQGMRPTDAVKAVKDRNDSATKALHSVIEERPIYLDRAPVLHRHSVIGGWAQITDGDAIELSPPVEGGLGADHDGDAVQIHVPSSDDAVKNVIDKMMPSQNLFSPANFDVHMTPDQEFAYGVWRAGKRKAGPTKKRFDTAEQAIAAYSRGEIDIDDPISIAEG